MIVGFIVEEAVAVLCIVMGLLIWLKKKVSLLHSYHYKHVKEEDIPAYSRLIGIGLLIIGVGIAVTGVLNLLYSPLWWLGVLVGFVIGLTVMYVAQKKYNGSIMG